MTCLCDSPWIFHRDEIDLLEEELDDIFLRYDPESNKQSGEMEARVLKEQLDTEDLSEAQLWLEIGQDDFVPDSTEQAQSAHLPEDSMADELRLCGERDPAYEQIYLWAQRVFAYTSKRYVEQNKQDEDIFRAHVNIKMIPIKFASAMSEREFGDLMSEQLADKERTLCVTYFERTLDSLEHLAFFGDEQASVLAREGKELERFARDL